MVRDCIIHASEGQKYKRVKSGYSDLNPVDGPASLHNSDLGYNDLEYLILCIEEMTIDTFGGHYILRNIFQTGSNDHLVVI